MLYLASPYSHKDPQVMQERFDAAEHACATLLQRKVWVYGPIVHCHAIAQRFKLPKDFNYWQEYNRHMIDRAEDFVILTIPGWKESTGVAGEYEHAWKRSCRIGLMDPKTFDIKWVRDDIMSRNISCLFEVADARE